MCDNDHGHGGYVSGPRYQVHLWTDQGVIFASTPMSGEEAHALMLAMRENFSAISSHRIDEQAARALLLRDAAKWREAAVSVEDNLVDLHTGFDHNAKDAWAHARRLTELARTIA